MDRLLKPERFDADPNSSNAAKEWQHWLCTFNNFLSALDSTQINKLNLLINYISPNVYEYVTDCKGFEEAISLLNGIYIKPKNEIFARHLLASCKQDSGQSLDDFVQKLRCLAKDCNFKPVNAEQYRDDAIRDAFISGLLSSDIRQRLLERKMLDFKTAFDEARSLEMAQKQSLTYQSNTCVAATEPTEIEQETDHTTAILSKPYQSFKPKNSQSQNKCYFCGYNRHPRNKCPARDSVCRGCGIKGHFLQVCRSTKSKTTASAFHVKNLASITVASAPSNLSKSVTKVSIHGEIFDALIDTGSSDSYVSTHIATSRRWHVIKSSQNINMASTGLSIQTNGHC